MFGVNMLATIVYGGKNDSIRVPNKFGILEKLKIFIPGEAMDGYLSDIDSMPTGEMSEVGSDY